MAAEKDLNKSLVKAIAVLDSFKDQPHEISFSKIVSLSKIEKSSAQRVVRTLKHAGFLGQAEEGEKYRLGVRLLDLAYTFLQSHPLIERVGPYLVDLRQASGERVDLSIRDGTDLVYVLRLQSKRDRYAPALFGRRLPLYCTAGGRSMLAHMPPAEAQSVLRASKAEAKATKPVCDPAKIMAQLKDIREAGFAFQQEEVRKGALAVGSAILDRAGVPVGAIHIAGALSDWDGEEFRKRMGALVVATASELNAS